MDPATQEALFVFVYLILYMFIIGYSVLAYVCQGLGMFRMMSSAGISHPWMGWVPGCNVYAMGRIADHQTSRNEGKTTAYRKKLLGLTIATYALISLFLIACVVVTVVATLNGMVDEYGNIDEITDENIGIVIGPSLFVLVTALAFFVVFIIYTVCYYVTLHKIFKLFAPDGAAGLTVLAVLVPVADPIIFLSLSKRKPVYFNGGFGESDPTAPADTDQTFYTL